MSPPQDTARQYRGLLEQTRRLYRSSARHVLREHPELAPQGLDFVESLDDLHRGLVLRVYLTVCEADRQWTDAERALATELCEHLWERRLEGADLSRVMREASGKTQDMSWSSLVGPFVRLTPLRDRVAEIETLVVRQSNVVARIDGVLDPHERKAIERIADALSRAFSPVSSASGETVTQADPSVDPEQIVWPTPLDVCEEGSSPRQEESDASPARQLDEVMADLDGLVGLVSVKEEIRSLANYIALQKRRAGAGFPATEISLHLVFTGNPGTGKTTVARLFGEAMRALEVLPGGQLVETDRSGLVAEYAGQTAPKTNKKVDEALGGVLFIDEAYSLVGADGDDPYGREAVQTLLKRAEDSRSELSVIIAGYPEEMGRLLDSNPGLTSRFARTIRFEDYGPLELCHIFGRLMEQHHYRLTPGGRLRVIQEITDLHARRDRHFGNGRAVRNLFERTILRMANRLATLSRVSDEQLVTFEADDVPSDDPLADPSHPATIRLACPACDCSKEAGSELLGASVKCPQCGERFKAEWCELVTR